MCGCVGESTYLSSGYTFSKYHLKDLQFSLSLSFTLSDILWSPIHNTLVPCTVLYAHSPMVESLPLAEGRAE